MEQKYKIGDYIKISETSLLVKNRGIILLVLHIKEDKEYCPYKCKIIYSEYKSDIGKISNWSIATDANKISKEEVMVDML